MDEPTPLSDEEATRLLLARPSVPCRWCGYNLSGLPEPRCPECGRTLTVDDLLVGMRGGDLAIMAGSLGLVIAFILGLPFGALFINELGISAELVIEGGHQIEELWGALCVASVGLALPAVPLGVFVLWCRRERRIRALPPLRRALLAAGCWLLDVVIVVMMVYLWSAR